MVDQLVRTIVEHPKRKLLVIILTFVMGVVFVLPAVEEYSAAQNRTVSAREKLTEAEGAAANVPQMQAALAKRRTEVEALESKAITERDVESLRTDLQRLIRDVGCEMREVYIEEIPTRRAWMSNDSPLTGAPVGNPGQETPFVLVQWESKIRLEGEMGSIYKFLAQLNQMDRLIHTKVVELKRSDINENQTQLRVEMTLFGLERKQARPGA